MSDPKADTTDQSCAVICMLVSNPAGKLRTVGWQKRVNDLIRALRDERNAAADRIKALEATLRKAQEALSFIESVYRKNCVAVGEPSTVLDALRATIAEIEKVLK